MNAARTITAQMTAMPMRLPAAPAPRFVRRADVADWDSEQVRDAVAAVIAADDVDELCCHSDRVMRVCKEIEILDAELGSARDDLASSDRVIVGQQAEMRDLRRQLATERQASRRMRDEATKMRDAIAKLERRRVAMSLELITLAVTGLSSAALTAQLNEHVRSSRAADFDLSDIDDTVVIDLEVQR